MKIGTEQLETVRKKPVVARRVNELPAMTPDELIEFTALFVAHLRGFDEWKARHPIMKGVHKTKISEEYSEALLKACGPAVIPGTRGWVRGGGADLRCIEDTASGPEVRKVEVKATKEGFSKFSEKDQAANYLVWLDLSCLHAVDPLLAEATVYVLPEPAANGLQPRHMVLKTFLANFGPHLRAYRAPLSEMINGKVRRVKVYRRW